MILELLQSISLTISLVRTPLSYTRIYPAANDHLKQNASKLSNLPQSDPLSWDYPREAAPS
jgi:hypothetical protein